MTSATRARDHQARDPQETGRGGSSSLAGTTTIIRLILRRDRVRLPLWMGGFGLFVVYIGAALPQLAPDEADLAGVTSLLTQPVGRMFTGPAFGMDAPTYERFFAAGYAPYLFILAALMSIMLVTRHTRAEEQSGRAELVRAGVTGRHTALTATLIVAVLANLAAAVVVTGLSVGFGYALPGSLLVGLATALTGLVFAGVTAVTVQLSEFSRSAAGMAGAVLGVAFVLRALGDMVAVGGSALSWASPLGWATQTAPFVHDRWAPLLLLAGAAVATIAIAFTLQRRRDFGASLVRPRPGAARAHPALGHPLGLATRLQRGGFLGWGIAILALGIVDGLFTQAMADAGEDMPEQLSAVFGSEQLVQGYIGFLGAFVAMLVAAYAVFAMQTLRAEESSGRTDAVLATPVSRVGWLGAHVVVVASGAALVTLVTGLATATAVAAVTGNSDLLTDTFVAHLVVLPAPMVVIGICAALYGLLPRAMTVVGWLLVAVIAVVDLFAELLDLPEWFRMLSPLWHLSTVPVEDFELVPFLLLLLATAVLVGLGLIGFRRRQVDVV